MKNGQLFPTNIINYWSEYARDRRLFNQKQSLYSYLKQQPCEGTYTIDIPADNRIARVGRKAWLAVRFGRVKIRRPEALKAFDYPPSVTLYAVEEDGIYYGKYLWGGILKIVRSQ